MLTVLMEREGIRSLHTRTLSSYVPTPTMADEDSDMTEVLAKLHTIGLISTDSKGFVRCPRER
jgi:hypothetical protein